MRGFFDACFRNTIDRTRFFIAAFVVRAEDVPRSFLPDLMPIPIQGDRFDHFGNGEQVDRARSRRTGAIFALCPDDSRCYP
jgi:hypothetical protein